MPEPHTNAKFIYALLSGVICAGSLATGALADEIDGGARIPRGDMALQQSDWERARHGLLGADHDDSYLYRLPYGDGVSFRVLQSYGSRLSHRGTEYFTVDFQMDEGTEVFSAREGIVVAVEDSFGAGCWSERCSDEANFVVVLHADGTTGEYFHLQRGSAVVALGDLVSRGEPLARSGNTGYSTTPHLHFGVYRATGDGRSQSVAVRFLTRNGIAIEPRVGARYMNGTAQRR